MNSGLRIVWLIGGLLFLAIAAIGVILPLLPTTPFLLLTAYCFARSSPRMSNWLLNHPTFGPLIDNWNRHGSIDRKSKIVAMIIIVATPVITVLIGVPWWALAAQLMVLIIVSTFILTRPDPP